MFRNVHNNLRITRILKCLGELGFEHYQPPLVHFFLEETLVKKNLSSVKRSVLDYFLFAVRDKRKRRELISYGFQHFEPKDKFVWCPRRIQKRFKKKAEAKRQDSPSRNKRDDEKQEEGESVRCEGLSVDPGTKGEGSSVDPLPLNNGNHVDNGEMDLSGSEASTVKSDEEENQIKPAENASSKPDLDTTQVKDAVEPKNISSSQKESRESLGNQVSESPKHSLKSSPRSERAGKLARTQNNTDLGISDHMKSTGDAFSMSSLETKDGEKTNGVDTYDLMDTSGGNN